MSSSLSPDLDTLLGDLERSIQERGISKGGEVFVTSSETRNTEERIVSSNGGTMKEDSKTHLLSSSPIHQNINELDSLLSDLSHAKYSNSTTEMTREAFVETTRTRVEEIAEYSVVEKKKQRPELISKDLLQRTPEKDALHRELTLKNGSVIENGNQWGYLGYGVWENNNKAASSATQELDTLMTSLNTFQIKDAPLTTGEVPLKAASLDEMLGDLKDNMNQQAFERRKRPIVGQVITALERCGIRSTLPAFTVMRSWGGKPYCEADYHRLFSPKCRSCGQAILDKCISALDSTWHPEHFKCFSCKGPFGEDGFHEHDGKAYCKGCFFGSFAPKCGGCSGPIQDQYISSLNAQWHRIALSAPNADPPSRTETSLSTVGSLTVRHIIIPCEDPCVRDATRPYRDAALLLCFESSTPNTLYVPSASSNSTKGLSRNRGISLIVMSAMIDSLGEGYLKITLSPLILIYPQIFEGSAITTQERKLVKSKRI
ncbi:Paxillinlike [Caligus rogercresseyi]|uniref:Paxillinlike n=1 Tax=Caligus rogercresseyi TaxID=217165 RepID=A0A7T8K7Z0_CALRO|nr:Paxillinlike [Caligus rogercresseyi]